MNRERLGSRLGFLLLSAGCAIGVGNIWKFPWLTGQNGGAAFVVIYLFFLLILGLPVMTVEFSLGRAARKSPVLMHSVLEPKKKAWGLHGFVCFIGNIILMMFYTVVTGWILYYFVQTLNGTFINQDTEVIAASFGNLVSDPGTLVGYMIVVCVAGFVILSIGLQKGLESVTKVMMSALFVIVIILCVYACTLPGAAEGLKFYLIPNFANVKPDTVVAAMNQAFFTLSIGMGSMAIFGSYVSNDRALMGEAINVILLDTLAALCAGFVIFPACFTYGVEAGAGPSLIFDTLPNIFNNMPLGRLWGSLFFLFLTFAAFSTVLAVCENIIACFMDLTHIDRKKASIICCVGVIILSLPCALGFNVWSHIEPLGAGTGIMDLEDFIVSNCILPLGSAAFVIFATWVYGWDKLKKEANKGVGVKLQDWMLPYMKYVLPIIIFIVFIIGIKPFLFK